MIGERNTRALALGLALIAAAGFAQAEELVESPLYKQWAKFKPGTSVTYEQVTDMAGQKMKGEMSYTLLSVTPEKAVVEMKNSMVMPDGSKMDIPATEVPFPAKVPKGDAVGAPTEEKDAPKPKITEGTGEVEVLGKKYKCKTTETAFTASGQAMTTKAWTSDEIPGGMLKNETKGEGMSTSMTVTKLTIK